MNKKTNIRGILFLCAFFLSSITLIGLTNQGLADTTKNNQTMPTIHISTMFQTTNTLDSMINDFNANYSASYGFKVQLDQSDFATISQHDTYVNDFKAESSSLDIISMDVIWPAEFSNAGWLLPMDNIFNTSYQAQFLQAPIQAATLLGHVYAVPWFHDSAMLFYRTDVLQYANTNAIINDPNAAPPTTWAQLSNWTTAMMSNTALVQKFNLTAGFVWQGKAYEGLMCDLMEYIGGTGTYSFLNTAQTEPIFNSSSGIKDALNYMKYLINSGTSPESVLTYDEEASRAVWNGGGAIFMRNWPYAYASSLNSPSLNGVQTGTNVQQFNVTLMPAQSSTVLNPKTSCLGGWELGVSAFSKYPDQAKKFIMWLTDAQNQLRYFLGNGYTPTIKSLYNNAAVINSKQGYVHNFLPAFENSIPRPTSPYYPQMSGKIYPIVNAFLGGSLNLSSTLDKLQSNVQQIINDNPLPGQTTTSQTNSGPTNTSGSTVTTNPGFEFFSILAVFVFVPIFIQKKKNGNKK